MQVGFEIGKEAGVPLSVDVGWQVPVPRDDDDTSPCCLAPSETTQVPPAGSWPLVIAGDGEEGGEVVFVRPRTAAE